MTTPKQFYRVHLFVCTNRRAEGHPAGCCASRGSEAATRYLKAKVKDLGLKQVRVNAAGCLHRCGFGPVLVIYPQGIWYTFNTEADLDRIFEGHFLGQGSADDLLLPDRPPEAAETVA
ncbi:MAG: (2Fe-2S) ferredoxin domain-containing protein [Rhodospirillaceae bacterium]